MARIVLRYHVLAILALAAALCASVVPMVALAASPSSISCSSTVYSEGGLLDSQQSSIQSLVSSMQNKRALVRVIGLRNMGGESSLDSFLDSYTSRCGNGSVRSRTLRSNMIVLAVSQAERKVTIHYGAGWSPSLSGKTTGIQNDMGGRFRVNDYPGGMVLGMQETNSVLSSRPAAVSTTGNNTSQQAVSGSNSDAGRIVLIIFLVLVGVVAVLLLIFKGIPYILNRRSEAQVRQDDRGEAQTQAEIAMRNASNAVHSLGSDLEELEQRLNALPISAVPAETLIKLRALLDYAKRGHSDALRAWSDNDSSASDPTKPGLTSGQYRTIGESYRQITEQVNNVRREYLGTLKAAVDALERDPKAEVLKPAASNGSTSSPTQTPAPVRTPAPSGSASRTATATSDEGSPGSGGGSTGSTPSFLRELPDDMDEELVEEIQRAEIDLRNAYSFCQTYGNYISGEAWRNLDSARSELELARTTRDVRDSTRRRHLRDARSYLREAIKIAREDVREERNYSRYGYYRHYSDWYPGFPVIVPIPYGVSSYGYTVPFYGYDGEMREVPHNEWQTTFASDNFGGSGQETSFDRQDGGRESDFTQQDPDDGYQQEEGGQQTDYFQQGSGQQTGWETDGAGDGYQQTDYDQGRAADDGGQGTDF